MAPADHPGGLPPSTSPLLTKVNTASARRRARPCFLFFTQHEGPVEGPRIIYGVAPWRASTAVLNEIDLPGGRARSSCGRAAPS